MNFVRSSTIWVVDYWFMMRNSFVSIMMGWLVMMDWFVITMMNWCIIMSFTFINYVSYISWIFINIVCYFLSSSIRKKNVIRSLGVVSISSLLLPKINTLVIIIDFICKVVMSWYLYKGKILIFNKSCIKTI